MPGPKPKPKANEYTENYSTDGQRVTGDGAEVIMSNGVRFKRTVLPSSAAPKQVSEADALLDELDDVE